MNDLTIVLVLLLIFMWKLDFITILLNLKNLSSKVPDEFKDVFDQEKYEKSQKYTRANSKFELISALMDLFLLLTFWLCGGFVWLNNIVVNLGFGTVLSGSIYLGALAIAQTMLSIPFNLYRTFILEKRFGFNKTTPALYFQDQLKGLLLTVIIGAPILALILWIFSSVSNAWLWAWIVVTAFSLLMTYLAPSFILPLFNKFTPLQDGELKDAINEMARKCNFPLTELFVIDGSKRSTKANAYFTGFGKLKKIALYDTLIEKQTKEELVAVLAHEIGHFKKKHIVQRMCLSVIQTGIIFYLLGLFTTPNTVISETIYEAFGFISNQPLYVGIAIFGILFKPVSFIIGILMNLWSRKHEFEADEYALHSQGSSEHLISALKKLSASNLSNLTPHPFKVFLEYSHPPVLHRIEALRKLES